MMREEVGKGSSKTPRHEQTHSVINSQLHFLGDFRYSGVSAFSKALSQVRYSLTLAHGTNDVADDALEGTRVTGVIVAARLARH